ncbi:MAG: Maltodextrin ABC transporter, substrate-binding protein MdxE [uncultured Thermomicrobiales bacterium]|uniref:Maltodextrin ABC transporter, substrate-binding protein MdxE n=1 Tax=uncultured Thermomicrobiales bacterium TaxID=1645740 RepID=A0A6J4V294_9BACT|nr:MAG: Maltodextrin ABC transporter, substrate-binding protein MdxE [uncultured Thermomicrobiales bacterium]
MTSQDLSTSHAALLRDAMAGRLSRRQALQRAVALGLSAPAMAGLMTAYRSSPVAAQDAPATSPLAGKTIDMSILGIGGWPPSRLGVDLATELFKPYAKETLGYDVNFTFEESPFDQLFQKAATSLQAESAQYNIIISDSQWLGALAEPGWILQLNDIIAENPELQIEFEPAAREGYQIFPDGSDQVWGLPQEGDTIALFVRQDLFSDQAERDAFKAANGGTDLPQTFEDWEQIDIVAFEKIAAHFTRPEQGLAGTAMQWSKVYDYISCYLYPFMFSTGGEIIEGDVGSYKIEGVLDSQVNADAMALNKRFLDYAPNGATNFGIPELVDQFTTGTCATCFQWSALGPQMMNQKAGAAAGEADDPSKPVTPENVMIVAPPAFKQADGSLKRVYALGGQPWTINAFNDADHLQVAVDYMKFWYRPETQLEFARRGGNPSVKATLDDPEFDTLQPHFRAFKYMIREGRSRDFWHDPNYAEMLATQQEAFSAYLTGTVEDPMQALKYTACEQQGILFDGERTEIEPSEACNDVSL